MLSQISMRSLALTIVLLASTLSAVAPRAAAQTSASVCANTLSDRIGAILQRPVYERMRWGILVQTQSGETLADHDAQRYFLPASTAKLLTTAAALQQFGSDFQIRTSVYQIPAAPNQVVLRIVGRGDPSLTDVQLNQLAQQIRDRGITRIQQLIGDDSFFQGDLFNPTWEWEDIQAGYGAPASSLILNQNRINLRLVPQALGQPLRVEWGDRAEGSRWRIDNRSRTVETTAPESLQVGRDLQQRVLRVRGQLRVGAEPEPVAVSVTQPSAYFMEQLRQALFEAGIQVDRITMAATPLDPTAHDAPEIAAIDSVPLSDLIAVTNQQSNNLYAESLLRWLGTARSVDRQGDRNSLSDGIAVLETTLTRLGVNPQSYRIADGSGLSRRNLVSPAALVGTLQQMAHSSNAAIYRDSLSIAGVSGTLRNSFRNTPIQGRLRAKTGSLTGVAALSGYFDPPHYSPLVFSLLVNQGGSEMDEVPQAIDEFLQLLVQLESCQEGTN